MENNAYNAIMEEVKKDFSERLAEANDRAKKAEKAFIDLTRRRSTAPIPGTAVVATSMDGSKLMAQKRSSVSVLNAVTPISFPYKSSMDKVRVSSWFQLGYAFPMYAFAYACRLDPAFIQV